MVVRTVFLTGASGFVGTHVAEELLRRGCEVRCLIRPGASAAHLDRPGVVRITGTLEDPDGYRDAIRGCDTVLHLAGAVAARTKRAMLRTNGRGTARLADACAAVETPPRLVAVSSLAAAGPPCRDRAIRDEADSPAPVSIYGRSKRAGETALERRAGRLPVTIVRPGIVFGPRDRQGAAVFRAIQRTGLHVVVGFRTPRLSLIHVDDLVDLLLRAAENGETLAPPGAGASTGRGMYFACDDREHPTYWQFGQRVAGALGKRVLVWPLWRCVGRMVGAGADLVSTATGTVQLLSLDKVREATAWSWACSAAKARTQLGFAPALPLDDRLRQTANWFREQGWL
jgi:nucleoside-diphosphate-sugar epimerase